MKRTLLLLLLAQLIAGCGGMREKDQASRLDDAITAYAASIRWGHFDTARAFTRPREQAMPRAADADSGFEQLKVTGYRVRIDRVNETIDEANVNISFTYYHEDQGTIRKVGQTDVWYFDPEAKSWFMDGQLPRFAR